MQKGRVIEIYLPESKSAGSGFLLTNSLVITANHVVTADPATTSVGRTADIRVLEDVLNGDTTWKQEAATVCWSDPELDLALLTLKPAVSILQSASFTPVKWGNIGRSKVNATALGFPDIQLINNRQNPEEVEGRASFLEGNRENQIRLSVTSNVPETAAGWKGISGAPVFADDFLIGIIVETNKSFAEKALWAAPIWKLADCIDFKQIIQEHGGHTLQVVELAESRRRDTDHYAAPFKSERLPEKDKFIDRKEEMEFLVDKVITGDADIMGIYGLPGCGKSVIAAAIAQDQRVRNTFYRGILWATLGQTPDLTSILHEWIALIAQSTGQAQPAEQTIKMGSARSLLGALIGDRKLLIVLDDVWEIEHAYELIKISSNCTFLLTTRDKTVIEANRGYPYELDVMSVAQSYQMLAGKSPLAADEKDTVLAIAKLLGHLPLALDLVRSQSGGSVNWKRLYEEMKSELSTLEELDAPGVEHIKDPAIQKRLSLELSLNMSLAVLAPTHLQCFSWLGLLREDVLFDEHVASVLWRSISSVRKPRRVLQELASKSLLRHMGNGLYKMHDILRARAIGLITEGASTDAKRKFPGLGLTQEAAHWTFLQNYRTLSPAATWHTIPADDYIQHNLFWHLLNAAKPEEAYNILWEETAGRNSWFETRHRSGQIAGYIADINQLLQATGLPATNDDHQRTLFLHLILSSIHSMANLIPASLITTLFEKKCWPLEQALYYTRRNTDHTTRFKTLVRLSALLQGEEKEKLLTEATSIIELIDTTDGSPQHELAVLINETVAKDLDQALIIAKKIADLDLRLSSLWLLYEHIPKHNQQAFVDELIDMTEKGNELYLDARMEAAFPHLSANQLKSYLDHIAGIQNAFIREQLTASALPRYAEIINSDEAIRIANTLQFPTERTRAQASLLQWMTEPARTYAIDGIIAALDQIGDEDWRNIIGEAAEALVGQFASMIQLGLADNSWRLEVLGLIEKYLTGQQLHTTTTIFLPPVLAEDLSDEEQNFQARALLAISPRLDQATIAAQIKRLGEDITESRFRINMFSYNPYKWFYECLQSTAEKRSIATKALSFIEYMPVNTLAELLHTIQGVLTPQECWNILQTLTAKKEENRKWQDKDFGEVIDVLGSQLNKEQLHELTDASRKIGDELYRLNALVQVSARCDEPASTEAIGSVTALEGIYNIWDQARILQQALFKPSSTTIALVTDFAASTQDHGVLAEILLPALAKHLPADEQSQVMEKALQHALKMEDYDRMGWALEKQVPLFTDQQWNNAASAVLALPIRKPSDRMWRAYALCSLLSKEKEAWQQPVINEIINTVVESDDPDDNHYLTGLIRSIAPFLNDGNIEMVVALTHHKDFTVYDSLLCRASLLGKRNIGEEFSAFMNELGNAMPITDAGGFMSPGEANDHIILEAILSLPPEMQLQYLIMFEPGPEHSRFLRRVINSIVGKFDHKLNKELFDILYGKTTDIGDIEELAETLTTLALAAPNEIKKEICLQAWETALKGTWHDEIRDAGRGRNIKLLSVALVEMDVPRDTLQELWSTNFPVMAERTRQDLLIDMGACAEILQAIGGKPLLQSIRESLKAIDRWFP